LRTNLALQHCGRHYYSQPGMYTGAARRLVAFGQTGLSCSENALHSMFSRACRAESKKESRGETGSSWISVEPACFAACITGLFFFAPFAYVYFPRSKGLWDGLAAGANWFFRDKSVHINFALEVINTIRADPPGTFRCRVRQTDPSQAGRRGGLRNCLCQKFAGSGRHRPFSQGHARLPRVVADQHLQSFGMKKRYGTRKPFSFMELQDAQELANFFERKVSADQR
jgi:hypothetical protein